MKKLYISPKTETIKVKLESLLVSYSNAEASSDAVSLSREGGDDFWDDEE
jgi:hypothetical protein